MIITLKMHDFLKKNPNACSCFRNNIKDYKFSIEDSHDHAEKEPET